MATSTVRDLYADLEGYTHTVLAYVDGRGYPINVPASYRADAQQRVVEVSPVDPGDGPVAGTRVHLLFSHVHPQPGIGYDQRRYISVQGTVTGSNGTVVVRPERVHGWDEERMAFFELCERSVPVAHRYMAKLSAEIRRPVKPRLSFGWLFFLATRVPFLTATFIPVLLGAVIARAHGHSAWWFTLLALIGASAVHLGLNVANDVSDASSGADAANVNPTMYSGGSRVIQYGLVTVETMRRVSLAFYAIGVAIGLFLAATRAMELLWIGAAGVFLSIFYTARPLRLVHRGLGEVCVALGFGPIMVLGSYAVVAQRLSWEALFASLPVALLIMLVLYVNQIPDRPADEVAGKRTVVVRFSKQTIVRGYALSAGLAFALIVAGALGGIMPAWTLVALAGLPLAVRVYRALGPFYDSPYELMPAMGTNVGLHAVTGALLIAGYVLSIFL